MLNIYYHKTEQRKAELCFDTAVLQREATSFKLLGEVHLQELHALLVPLRR